MKSFKDYVTMNEKAIATITLPKAKNDQEIYDRLKLLKDAGIEAQSGGRSAHTDINVSSKDVAKAKKLLGLNEKDLKETAGYVVTVAVRDARAANELAKNSYRNLYKNDGSDVFVFKKESDKEDFKNDLLDMELEVLNESSLTFDRVTPLDSKGRKAITYKDSEGRESYPVEFSPKMIDEKKLVEAVRKILG